MFYFDPNYLLFVALPVMALTLLVQLYLQATYARYSQIGTHAGYTGAQAARKLLDRADLRHVRVEEVQGFLSDHYDPRHHVLRLSPQNYEGRSIAALGVAAHEAGHALQHAEHYPLMVVRNLAVPMASLGSSLGYVALMLGLLMQLRGLALIGFVLLCGILVFQLVNLPVEFNASKRALQLLPATGILTPEENRGAQKVLAAAALTYVAAMIAILWELIYYAMRLGLLGGSRREE